ncbi:HAMP domain-containing protein [Alkalinema sp. FACHB-956]|nr:HAMP domain-containing protein [Alkalinema sp. FACHB-956]
MSLLPIGIAGTIVWGLTYQRAAQQAETRLKSLAGTTAELTHRDLESKLALLKTIAATPLVLDSVKMGTLQADAMDLPKLPIEQVEAQFRQTKLIQPNLSLNQYLKSAGESSQFAEIFITERYGFNVAYSQPTSDFVQSDEAWWQHGKHKEHWIGTPKFDQSTQRVTIEMVAAIYDSQTRIFSGVLKGGYDADQLEYLKKDVQNLQLVGSEQLQLIAVGTQPTVIATVQPKGISSSQEIPDQAELLKQLRHLVNGAVLSDRLSFEDHHLVYWVAGDRQYALMTIPETNWVTVTSVKLTQIQAAGYQVASMFSWFFLGLSIVVTVGIVSFARTISAPLNHLASVVQQATEKADFTLQAAATNSTHEVGVLSQSFNQLLQRVQQLLQEQQEAQYVLESYNQTLEQKVQRRTQQLEKYSQTLEQKVEERTQALREKTLHLEQTLQKLQSTQAQMVQAEKMSSLGQLVAGIAHEINNPVNFIHGNLLHAHQYAQDLFEVLAVYETEYPYPTASIVEARINYDLNFLKDDLPKLLTSMQTGTERIRDIVKSLRNFSRLDEADIKTVDIHEGIDSTLMILGHRLKAQGQCKPIDIVRDYGNVPPVECYAGQLNQVFMNVIANAIDAIQEKPLQNAEIMGRIGIRTSVIRSNWVEIAISDTGSGIPPDVQQRIFDPFFTTKPVGQGTGMGMSISYQIVTEKHKGHLKFCSTPGVGTEFVIHIPMQAANADPSEDWQQQA